MEIIVNFGMFVCSIVFIVCVVAPMLKNHEANKPESKDKNSEVE